MKNWRIEFESGSAIYITGERTITEAIHKAQTQAWELTGKWLPVVKAEVMP